MNELNERTNERPTDRANEQTNERAKVLTIEGWKENTERH